VNVWLPVTVPPLFFTVAPVFRDVDLAHGATFVLRLVRA
jgi:hypothetical protein